MIVWRWVQDVPALAWLTSSTGLLVLALGWIGFLLVRPWSWIGSDGWRVERVRALLCEVATELEVEAAKPPAKNFHGSGGYVYIQADDFIDDACVASVKAGLTAFLAKEKRMYEAADVTFSPFGATAVYLRHVAERLTFDDLDPGFRILESFADWRKGHQPNIWPVKWPQ